MYESTCSENDRTNDISHDAEALCTASIIGDNDVLVPDNAATNLSVHMKLAWNPCKCQSISIYLNWHSKQHFRVPKTMYTNRTRREASYPKFGQLDLPFSLQTTLSRWSMWHIWNSTLRMPLVQWLHTRFQLSVLKILCAEWPEWHWWNADRIYMVHTAMEKWGSSKGLCFRHYKLGRSREHWNVSIQHSPHPCFFLIHWH